MWFFALLWKFLLFCCEAILPQISAIFCEKRSCVKLRWCKYQVCMELPEVNLEDINVKEYPDLKALCLTYLMEDAPNMKETQRTFYDAWYKINIGEQVLGSFINFLKTQGPLPTTFMLMSGLQYRWCWLPRLFAMTLMEPDPLFRQNEIIKHIWT